MIRRLPLLRLFFLPLPLLLAAALRGSTASVVIRSLSSLTSMSMCV